MSNDGLIPGIVRNEVNVAFFLINDEEGKGNVDGWDFRGSVWEKRVLTLCDLMIKINEQENMPTAVKRHPGLCDLQLGIKCMLQTMNIWERIIKRTIMELEVGNILRFNGYTVIFI